MNAAPARLGRFEVERELGRGGYGAVYRAFDPELQRSVAIKLLAAPAAMPAGVGEHSTLDLRAGGGQRDALLAEARVMAQLSHPNVLPVYEVGLADGALFLVMELIAGQDLRRWLASAPRTVDEVIAVFVQATTGLAAAHGRGIVHRDVKPDNILVGDDGRVRVADFGLAGLVGAGPGAAALARVGEDAGTPRYMASELWRGAPATPASDVYALATAMIEALTGEVPGDGPAGRAATARALAMRQVPAPMVGILLAAVSEQPQQRPRDAGVLLAALTTRPARARSPLVAGVVLALAGAAGVAAAALTTDAPVASCEPDPARLAGVWDQARRQALAAKFGTSTDQAEILDAFDRRVLAVASARAVACEDQRARRISAAQRDQRERCLDRRMAELAARVEVELERRTPDLAATATAISRQLGVEGCALQDTGSATFEPADALRARYLRFARVAARPAAERDAAYADAAAEADAVGDVEIVARVSVVAARTTVERDPTARPAMQAALERAYQAAQAARADEVALLVLLERAALARTTRRDGDGAEFAALARQQMDGPAITPSTRVRVLQLFGRIAMDRGDYAEAARQFQAALPLLPRPLPGIRFDLLADLAQSLARVPGQRDAAVRVTAEAIAFAEKAFGPNSEAYADALVTGAVVANRAGDVPAAIAHYRAAIALFAKVAPRSVSFATARSNLAGVLANQNELDEADALLDALLPDTTSNQNLRFLRGSVLSAQANVASRRGRRDEAVDLMSEAVLEYASRSGTDSVETRRHQGYLVIFQTRAGQLDAAERGLDKLLAALPPGDPSEVDLLLSRATLEMARMRYAKAVTAAARAVALAEELKLPGSARLDALAAWARALAKQGAWAELLPVATRWRDAEVPRGNPGRTAWAEFYLARVKVALGDDGARDEARAALTTLTNTTADPDDLREHQAWLDELDRPAPPPAPKPRRPGRPR